MTRMVSGQKGILGAPFVTMSAGIRGLGANIRITVRTVEQT